MLFVPFALQTNYGSHHLTSSPGTTSLNLSNGNSVSPSAPMASVAKEPISTSLDMKNKPTQRPASSNNDGKIPTPKSDLTREPPSSNNDREIPAPESDFSTITVEEYSSPVPSTSKNVEKMPGNKSIGKAGEAGNLVATSPKLKDTSCFQHIHRDGKHYVVCQPCASHPELVKQFSASQNKKLPPIAQVGGTLYREETIRTHLQTPYHHQAVKKCRLESLNPVERIQSTAIGATVSKQNEQLANKIGKLMIHIYCDAKKLTLSAFSFPARIVTAHMASEFAFNSDKNSAAAMENYDFQYLYPAFHLEAMKHIVSSYRKTFFSDLLDNSLAVSLRCDGSVDRTQIDKIYVLAKCITKDGEAKELFLGSAEPETRGADGILQAVKNACNLTLDCTDASSRVFHITSSLVTDGASVNIGHQNGLWTLFKNEKGSAAESESFPFVTFWCAVHRTNLAWKQVTRNVQELNHLISQLSSISTYFHESAVRTRELKQIGEEQNIKILHFPRYYEVRWAEFTKNLFNTILSNWLPLVLYFEKNKAAKECDGYFKFLTSEENLKLISGLADILAVFSHYQKSLQSNSTTILDIAHFTSSVKNKLDALRTTSLLGGWVSTLNENLKNQNSSENTVNLHGVTLQCLRAKRRTKHHLYVTDHRSSDAIVNDTIEALKNFLDERLSLDDAITTPTSPFITLQPETQLQAVQQIWGPDINLEELGLQFSDLLEYKDIASLRTKPISEIVKFLANNEHFQAVAIIMARIFAAKPHSADVERLISANNILKTSLRNSLDLETENLYLFIHYNMACVEEWSPKSAVVSWLTDKKRRVKDHPKARHQDWFKTIFREAHKDAENVSTKETAFAKRSFVP